MIENQKPTVSVLMSVYNGDGYLRQSIDSILNQSYRDFEFIVVDDGSTDRTPRILDEYEDPRLRVIRQENIGLTQTLNKIIDLANGEYSARQDADDISAVERLKTQVEFLDKNTDVALVGTWGEQIDTDGDSMGVLRRKQTHADIKANLINENEFLHGSIMIRTEALKAIGKYRPHFRFAQDYDLVLRLVEHYQLANIPSPLYKKRHIQDAVSMKNTSRQKYFSKLAQALYSQRLASEKDALDSGASLDGLVDHDSMELPGASYYEENAIYLYFRSANYRKARAEIKKMIRKHPLRLKSYVQYLVTFFGPKTVAKIVRRWEAE